ncbi:MAG: hypothetical protein ACFFAG_17300 [Promethearchaeota archaeon]
MVKYNHCEKCKRVYDTEPWIGEVHAYNGICPSCMETEQDSNQLEKDIAEDRIENIQDTEHVEEIKNIHKSNQSSPLEIEKRLLSGLEQKAGDVILGEESVDVLIKEIRDGLIDKAKKRIGETFQSFDSKRIDAQKIVDYVENMCEYLSEYEDYMKCVVKKLRDKPKLKVKTAIDKVFKETMANMPKDIAKDVLLNKKAMLKIVFGKAEKWYSIYSDIEDASALTKKMVLHPFTKIQKKFSTLPFYS